MKQFLFFVLLSLVTAAYRPAPAEVKVIPLYSNQSGVELSPDGKTIATHEIGVVQGDEIYPDLLPIRLFDVETGTEKALLTGHTDYAVDIAFSPDSRTLASYHFAGYLYLWDVETATLIKQIPTVMAGSAIRFLQDGKTVMLFISNNYNPAFLLLDTDTGAISHVLMNRYESRKDFFEYIDRVRPSDIVSAFVTAPDEQFLWVMMATGNLFRWEMEQGKAELIQPSEEAYPVFHTRKIIFSPDGSQILYEQREEAAVHVLDAATGAEQTVISTSGISTFDLAPDGDTLVWLDSEAGSLNTMSLSQPDAPPTVIPLSFPEGLRAVGPMVALEFLPDSQRVMLGGLAHVGEPENALYIVKVK